MDDKQSALYQTYLRFIKSLSGRNVSQHTVTAYQTDVLQFLTWLTANDGTVASPTHISRTHIIDYLSHLAGLGRSGVTRAESRKIECSWYLLFSREIAAVRKPAESILGSNGIQSLREGLVQVLAGTRPDPA